MKRRASKRRAPNKAPGKQRPSSSIHIPKLQPRHDRPIEEIVKEINDGAQGWREVTGEPMPNSVEEWKVAAVRYGMPPDVVQSGEFTGSDVWYFVLGRKHAQLDDEHRALRRTILTKPASAPTPPQPPSPTAAAVGKPATTEDQKLAGIVRGLSNNARSMMRFLLISKAFCRASAFTLDGIADELKLSNDAVRVARRCINSSTPKLLESARGPGGGVWLTPTGERVASMVPPETCLQAALAETRPKKHK
jgi:hypothetical protein